MKDVEIRLISELMKNSHRSDRELAKTIGASQPTVTRLRSRLEKEGIIREYTMIPDFRKLGFEIAVITFIKFSKELSNEEFDELRKTATEIQRKNPAAILAALNGMGLGFNRVFISFHKNYSSYMKVISLIKTHARYVDASHVESFIISLIDELHYQPLTLSTIADYLLKLKEEKKE